MFFDDHDDTTEAVRADSIEPDFADVQQYEEPAEAVRVKTVGMTLVHELPARVANSRTLTVADAQQGDAGAAVEIIGDGDERRKYLKILCTGQPIYVGHDKQSVIAGTAAVLPAGVLLELPTSAPIMVRCATPAQTAVVSYWAGYWAD
jgi:hypothetical protein